MLLSSEVIAESGSYTERRRINFFTEFTFSSNSITTKQSDSTSSAKTSSSFSAIELGMDYFFHDKIALTGQFLIVYGADIDAEITGFDLGARFYPLNKGYQSYIKVNQTKIELTPKFSPFLLGGYSSRTYQFSSNSLKFQGLEAGVGMDYHLKKNYFLRGSVSYQILQNTTKRSLNGSTLGLSIGYAF